MTTVDERTRRRLSTGHVVELPLDLSFAMGGVTVPARRNRLDPVLPRGLSSLAIAPGVGCVALVGIQYHRVGRETGRARDGAAETGLDPYDEFAVIVPVVRGSRTNRPLAQLADGEVGGYVHWLPVTTDPSVALGREIWGFPKEAADVTVTDGSDRIRVTVAGDGDREPIRL
ncbi:acetoacetate decarboxylase family protein, partial [Natrialba asiatica]|uniref:acetoacetate decarboxylase family protein n=1 Tax=Natrialba asiatica TaxID=64602 RepID=UPI00067801DC